MQQYVQDRNEQQLKVLQREMRRAQRAREAVAYQLKQLRGFQTRQWSSTRADLTSLSTHFVLQLAYFAAFVAIVCSTQAAAPCQKGFGVPQKPWASGIALPPSRERPFTSRYCAAALCMLPRLLR